MDIYYHLIVTINIVFTLTHGTTFYAVVEGGSQSDLSTKNFTIQNTGK